MIENGILINKVVDGVKYGITKSPSSGVVDLGTVLTAHQSLASYATQSWVNTQLNSYVAKDSDGVVGVTRLLAGANMVDDGYDIQANTAYISELEVGSMDVNMLTSGGHDVLTVGNTSFTRSLTSGTKIGTIKIGGTSTDIYAPSSSGGSFNGGTVANATTFNNRVTMNKGLTIGSFTNMSFTNAIYGLTTFTGMIEGYSDETEDLTWYITGYGEGYFTSIDTMSDANLKTVIEDVRLSLGTIANAPLVQFDWNNKPNKKHHVGTIAQYWEGCLPEVVSRTKDDTLALSYGELGVAMGISLAKEMTDMLTRVDNTETEVDKLKKRIEELEKEIEVLKAA